MDENNAGRTAIETTERLQAAAERLEKTVAWLEERQASLTGDVARIVATVDATADARQRELERKLEEAEQQIAELKAQAAAPASGRMRGGRNGVPFVRRWRAARGGSGIRAGGGDRRGTAR